ncbi:MAG: type II toxin-antitoxin system Phd/YefM family antitoxin [Alphaproteobacteria bacterium]|nr:type II toxin-antitoxin system Phd/YefM family antitoxin [Alphaproteobacteria bacterium]
MTMYSVADAKNNLSELIDRALKGEGVMITRHGTPVIEFKAIPAPAKPVRPDDLDWLAARRLHPTRAPAEDAGTLISRMRDEDGH